MGCDIHAYMESQGANSQWRYMGTIDLGRNYALFALMAGVRHDERISNFSPLFEPRGLPDDLSFTVQGDAKNWDGDGHSHSWLSLDELKQVNSEYGKIEMADTSWFQSNTLEEQPPFVGEVENKPIKVTKIKKRYGSGVEYYVQVGDITPCGEYVPLSSMIAAMEATRKPCRLVFWFDN